MSLASVRNIPEAKFLRVAKDPRSVMMEHSKKRGCVEVTSKWNIKHSTLAFERQLKTHRCYPEVFFMGGFIYQRHSTEDELTFNFTRTKVRAFIGVSFDYGYFDSNRKEYGL